jgi:hypothetical protein
MVYNPGGQIGKSVEGGGQKPAKDPDGPFLGKAAKSAPTNKDSPPDDPAKAARTKKPGEKDEPDAS